MKNFSNYIFYFSEILIAVKAKTFKQIKIIYHYSHIYLIYKLIY